VYTIVFQTAHIQSGFTKWLALRAISHRKGNPSWDNLFFSDKVTGYNIDISASVKLKTNITVIYLHESSSLSFMITSNVVQGKIVCSTVAGFYWGRGQLVHSGLLALCLEVVSSFAVGTNTTVSWAKSFAFLVVFITELTFSLGSRRGTISSMLSCLVRGRAPGAVLKLVAALRRFCPKFHMFDRYR